MAGDFADTDHVAIGGGNKKFVSGIEIFDTKSLLLYGDSSFTGNFKQDSACDPFETS